MGAGLAQQGSTGRGSLGLSLAPGNQPFQFAVHLGLSLPLLASRVGGRRKGGGSWPSAEGGPHSISQQ